MRYTVWQWSRLGRWADKSARPELVEGRAVGCSWFDRLTTSVGTHIGAQQTRHYPPGGAVCATARHVRRGTSVAARPARRRQGQLGSLSRTLAATLESMDADIR